MGNNERGAIQASKNRKWLLKRLLSAKSTLNRAVSVFHAPWKFDFKLKCLTSRNKKLVLQWQTRRFPEKPINYKNQQTTQGIVILKEI